MALEVFQSIEGCVGTIAFESDGKGFPAPYEFQDTLELRTRGMVDKGATEIFVQCPTWYPLPARIPEGVEKFWMESNFDPTNPKYKPVLKSNHFSLPSTLKSLKAACSGKIHASYLQNLPENIEEIHLPNMKPQPLAMEILLWRLRDGEFPHLHHIHTQYIREMQLSGADRDMFTPLSFRRKPFLWEVQGTRCTYSQRLPVFIYGTEDYNYHLATNFFEGLDYLMSNLQDLQGKTLSHSWSFLPDEVADVIYRSKYLLELGMDTLIWTALKNSCINNEKFAVEGSWLYELKKRVERK